MKARATITGSLIALGLMIASTAKLTAQQFISKGVIEFEVKTNVKKTMGNNIFEEQLKDQMSDFKTAYYKYIFDGGKSIFKFDRWDPASKIPEWFKRNDEENSWYFDHNNNRFNMQKQMYGTPFNAEDSIPVLRWKMVNESRVIAGFNCRKAVAKISDSVYVFAFYTDEITIPGGPCSINGLPGMILGLTIPRLYVSYIATKLQVNNVPVAEIKPVAAKKPFTLKGMYSIVQERTKEWVNEDNPDSKKWRDQLLWSIML